MAKRKSRAKPRSRSTGKAGAAGKTTSKKKPAAKTGPKTARAKSTTKRTGILDAAAQILAKAKEPMRCKEIVEKAIGDGLWTTAGKTPAATLYSSILREISSRGKDTRFVKVDRGRFQLRGKGS